VSSYCYFPRKFALPGVNWSGCWLAHIEPPKREINHWTFLTSAAGSVRVELQDAQGVPLPGFALADSEVMYGDSLQQPMLWRGNPDLGRWAGTPVRLRFVLKDADLFSMRFR
jgi:hypothetical protein